MLTIKYVLCPGYVQSKNDGDTHYIDAKSLARLYKVRLDECVVLPVLRRGDTWTPPENIIYLRPSYEGDYTLPSMAPIC